MKVKNIALVAHDRQKADLVGWVDRNADKLFKHRLICTGTTGRMIQDMAAEKHPEKVLNITLLKSGPLGGDQQLGSMITERKVDFMFFLTDPMTPQPHDVDVKALIRVAIIYNIVMACNLTSADFIISSPLFDKNYEPVDLDYSHYVNRQC